MGADSLERQMDFVVQQGLARPTAEACPMTYGALQFQPRVLGVVTLIATLLQSPSIFAAMAAILLWSAALPRWSPFDALHNQLFPDRHRLHAAPPPRRFAQALAGAMAASVAALLLMRLRVAATIIAGMLLAAIAGILFRGFCFGSYLFHQLSRVMGNPRE